MRLQIYKNPDDKNTKIGFIEIKNELARVWYEEIMKRFKISEWEIFDVDEAFETWAISINHLWEMLKFINNK